MFAGSALHRTNLNSLGQVMAVNDARCTSFIVHTSCDTDFLSKANDYFSHIRHRTDAQNRLTKIETTSYRTRNLQVKSQMRYLFNYPAGHKERELCGQLS